MSIGFRTQRLMRLKKTSQRFDLNGIIHLRYIILKLFLLKI